MYNQDRSRRNFQRGIVRNDKTDKSGCEKMTIGQMARMNHISEQTLRLYDREGLLSPLGRDEKNGYRYYDIRQSAQLDMIQYMKALGMPLKEIRVHMKNGIPGV